MNLGVISYTYGHMECVSGSSFRRKLGIFRKYDNSRQNNKKLLRYTTRYMNTSQIQMSNFSAPNKSCVIIGGGASGQTVATLLKKRNVSTIIVQANGTYHFFFSRSTSLILS